MDKTCCSWVGCMWNRHVVVGWGVTGLDKLWLGGV